MQLICSIIIVGHNDTGGLMNLLIPYIPLQEHNDPLFSEFTYGDVSSRGYKLRNEVSKGNYLFYHTSKNGIKYITAYYVVDRVMDTKDAVNNINIISKFRNPHLEKYKIYGKPNFDDVIVFSDPITSRVLTRPLPFDKALAEKLSLNINFACRRTENQTIVSSTRAWRELSKADVKIILKAIKNHEDAYPILPELRSTDEVSEFIEQDIENYVAHHPGVIGKDLSIIGRQVPLASGRADLILSDEKGNITVVELKVNRIGRDAIKQVSNYVSELKQSKKGNVIGAIVCPGVMPAYEEVIRKQKKVKILIYGWSLQIRPWQ